MDDDLKTRVAAWAAENPEGAAALRAEGAAMERASIAQELSAARADGATAERERVAAIRATVPPGYSALADELIASGADVSAAALAVCARVRQEQEAAATIARAEAAPPVAFAAATEPGEEARVSGILGPGSNEEEIHAAVCAYQAANPGVSYVDAFRAISQGVN